MAYVGLYSRAMLQDEGRWVSPPDVFLGPNVTGPPPWTRRCGGVLVCGPAAVLITADFRFEQCMESDNFTVLQSQAGGEKSSDEREVAAGGIVNTEGSPQRKTTEKKLMHRPGLLGEWIEACGASLADWETGRGVGGQTVVP